MERPKLAGFRNDGQAYLLTAKRALQDVKKPTVVELESVDGEIGSAGGQATHVSSDSGVYDTVGETMEFSYNVRITNGRANVLMRSAKFDFKSGAYRATNLSRYASATARPSEIPTALSPSITVRN